MSCLFVVAVDEPVPAIKMGTRFAFIVGAVLSSFHVIATIATLTKTETSTCRFQRGEDPCC
jgi:hypothetical protein